MVQHDTPLPDAVSDPLDGARTAVHDGKDDALDPVLHFEFGKRCLMHGQAALAYAELKTAVTLGMEPDDVMTYQQLALDRIPPHEDLDHNQYYRYKSLADELEDLAGGRKVSILDVGGGTGHLAHFLPEAGYCLAEPQVNGISGTELPFKDGAFDFVVACHVLEHIPPEQRERFLEQLWSKARDGLILLNPFHVEGTSVRERLELFVEIMNVDWAKEHLECTLPDVQIVQDFAETRGLVCTIKPNGTVTTSAAMVFVNYFAQRAGCINELQKVNRFSIRISQISSTQSWLQMPILLCCQCQICNRRTDPAG